MMRLRKLKTKYNAKTAGRSTALAALALLVTACASPGQKGSSGIDSTLPADVPARTNTDGRYQTSESTRDSGLDAVNAIFTSHQGRVQFENNAVSDQRSQVLREATARFGSPECVSTKTGLINSRKAAALEDCVFNLPAQQLAYAGAPIESIRYRFLDERLLQMKLIFVRKTNAVSSVDAVQSRLSSDLGLPPPSISPSFSEWRVAQDQITLQQFAGGSTAALKISDARLTPLVVAMPN